MLEVFDNDSINRFLCVRRRDCVPSVELRRRLCITSILVLLVQKRLRWFCHAARSPEGELTKGLLLPTPPRTWRRQWRKDLVKVSSELAQDRRARSVSVRDVVKVIGVAGSTRPKGKSRRKYK